MTKKNIHLHPAACRNALEKTEQGLRVHFADGGVLEADQVMYATGRHQYRRSRPRRRRCRGQ